MQTDADNEKATDVLQYLILNIFLRFWKRERGERTFTQSSSVTFFHLPGINGFSKLPQLGGIFSFLEE